MKHWQNRAQPNDLIIATTSTLDFAPIFLRPELAETMASLIFEAKTLYGAILHAFVVMPEHIHLLLHLPPNMDAPTFMKRLKAYSCQADQAAAE